MDDIDISKAVSELSGEDMRIIAREYSRSEIAQISDHLEYVLDSSELSKWEVERLSKVFDKFAAKYTSPLAKAME